MKRILFVCLGNICRSPLAEAVFNHRIKERQMEKRFQADSCGTANYHVGDTPDPRTVKNALANGVVIDHRGRQFSSEDFNEFDLILPMDKSNLKSLLQNENALPFRQKIRLMREFDSVEPGSDVPDPYYGNAGDFQKVFDILDRSVDGLIVYLLSE